MPKLAKDLPTFIIKTKKTCTWPLPRKAFDELKDVFRDIIKVKGRNGMEMLTELAGNYINFTIKNKMYNDAILNFMGIMKLYIDEKSKHKIDPLILESDHFLKLLEIHHDCAKLGIQMVSLGIKDGSIRPELQPEVTFYTVWTMLIGFERLMGPIGFEGKDIKIHLDNMKPGFIKLMQDMLKGSIQAQRPQAVQASLF
jgi:hypothetical protein